MAEFKDKHDRLPPPTWDPEATSYEDWRFQVGIWKNACARAKLKGSECAYRLYDKLKDVKSQNVGDKVTVAAQIGEFDVFEDDGVDNLLKVLDKAFKKDDLTLLHQSWRKFIQYRRSDESIDDFLNTYEKNVAGLKRDGTALPDSVLGMQLIDAANLSENQVQLVLTAVDYEEADKLYEQAKKSLRKFMSKMKNPEMTEHYDDEMDVNIASAGHYRNQRGRGGRRFGSNFNKNSNKNNNYHHENDNEVKRGRGSGRGRGRGGKTASTRTRKLNPLDEDGNPLTCNICNSVYHFSGKNGENCPESYENMNKQDEEEVEEACEVIDIKTEEVMECDIGYSGLLDCCCSSSVMGVEWKETFFNDMSKKDRESVKEFLLTTVGSLIILHTWMPWNNTTSNQWQLLHIPLGATESVREITKLLIIWCTKC